MLWGCTNPLIKLGSRGITTLPKRSHPVTQFLAETYYLFTRWQVVCLGQSGCTKLLNPPLFKYLLPFVLNLSGSVVFFWSLGSSGAHQILLAICRQCTHILSAELSLVVPITNSLTLFFTSATSQLLGETRGISSGTPHPSPSPNR